MTVSDNFVQLFVVVGGVTCLEEHFALPRSRHGWPKKDVDSNIIERFAEMSKPWGVDIQIENGIGVVQL